MVNGLGQILRDRMGGSGRVVASLARFLVVHRIVRLLPSCIPNKWGGSGTPWVAWERSNAYRYEELGVRVASIHHLADGFLQVGEGCVEHRATRVKDEVPAL